MAEVTAAAVKELREKTGAGMMDCKKALAQSGGDMNKAIDWLREKGLAAAQKKASRIAAEGTVASYIHGGGRIGVLVEINCETDFVGRGEAFQQLAKEIAMQIAAASPKYVRREEVPEAELEHEREVYRGQLKEQGKPEKIWDKIVEGKLEKYYKDVCLLEQAWVKDPDKTIQQVVNEAIAKTGENINVRRFARFALGEGLQKKSDDFAAEVAKAAGLA
jgi:elongation factor Ts